MKRCRGWFNRLTCGLMTFIFITGSVTPAFTQTLSLGLNAGSLPDTGTLIAFSAPFDPPALKGLKIYANTPFHFDFILDKGETGRSAADLSDESTTLIKYFLASLTIPEKDLWVNLSPYEKNRIIPAVFGQTEMGRDLLAEDYLLKQITASVIHPEDPIGKRFWDAVYQQAFATYGTSDIPINTFNKVWIIPDKAVVFENISEGAGQASAFIVESHLKVMLESDYASMENSVISPANTADAPPSEETQELAQQVIREIILPALEKEINTGKHFAKLRQIYQSLILAAWYKRKILNSLLATVYVDQNKVSGITTDDPRMPEKIWDQYVSAFKTGVFNFIREEPDGNNEELVTRKYFSGGLSFDSATMDTALRSTDNAESLPRDNEALLQVSSFVSTPDRAASTLTVKADQETITRPVRQILDKLTYMHNDMQDVLEKLLDRQDSNTGKLAFLPPNLPHIARAIGNAENILEGQSDLRNKLLELFDNNIQKTQQVLQLVMALSKIGFAHDKLDVNNEYTYTYNRIFAMELIDGLKDQIITALDITEAQYQLIREAVLREGTFGVGTENEKGTFIQNLKNVPASEELKTDLLSREWFNKDKFENPLTIIATLASEMDIGYERLLPWQRNEEVIKVLLDVVSNGQIINFYAQRTAYEQARLALAEEISILEDQQADTSLIAERKQQLEQTDRQIQTNRELFNHRLKELIHQKIGQEDIKDRIIKDFIRQGNDTEGAEKLYAEVLLNINAVNSVSYLWYLGSLAIEKVSFDPAINAIVVNPNNISPLLGAAAQLPGVQGFHSFRLSNIISYINKILGSRLELREIEQNEKDLQLHHEIGRSIKSEGHLHLAMGIGDVSVFWNYLLSPEISSEDLNTKMISDAQAQLKSLFQDDDIDLLGTITAAKETAGRLFEFNQKYKQYLSHLDLTEDYGYPQDMNDLVHDAQMILDKSPKELTATAKRSTQMNIDLYWQLQRYVRHLFNFQEGALTDFVKHYEAFNKGLRRLTEKNAQDAIQLREQLINDYFDSLVRMQVRTAAIRFNVAMKKDTDTNLDRPQKDTLEEILLTIQAYKKWQAAQAPGTITPRMRIIMSITKPSAKKMQDDRSLKTDSARVLVNILAQAKDMKREGKSYDAIKIDEQHRMDIDVSPDDVLQFIAGVDGAGQEEGNPPAEFFDAYALINEYNQREMQEAAIERRPPDLIGTTFHVSESITDVSPESGMRHGMEAIFMRPFNEVDIDADGRALTPATLNAVGHLIVPALASYTQFLGKTATENIDERIAQIQFDLKLLSTGIPLISVDHLQLEADLARLTDIRARMNAASGSDETAALQSEAAPLLTYTYTEDAVMDLFTRARYLLDVAIEKGITVETNPTSNVGIAPGMSFETHTLKVYQNYSYRSWTKDLQEYLNKKYNNTTNPWSERLAALESGAARSDFMDRKVTHTCNTDDPALFATDLNEEYFRVAKAMNLSSETIRALMMSGLNNPIRAERGMYLLREIEEGLSLPDGIPLDAIIHAIISELNKRNISTNDLEQYIAWLGAKRSDVTDPAVWDIRDVIAMNLEAAASGITRESGQDRSTRYSDLLETIQQGLPTISTEAVKLRIPGETSLSIPKEIYDQFAGSSMPALITGKAVGSQSVVYMTNEGFVVKLLKYSKINGISITENFRRHMGARNFEEAIDSLAKAEGSGIARFEHINTDGRHIFLQEQVALIAKETPTEEILGLFDHLAREYGLFYRTSSSSSKGNIMDNIGYDKEGQLVLLDFLNLKKAAPRLLTESEKDEIRQEILRNPSQNTSGDLGGIDLNPARIKLNVQDEKFEFKFDPKMIDQLKEASGLIPTVIDIKPLDTPLSLFLGGNEHI